MKERGENPLSTIIKCYPQVLSIGDIPKGVTPFIPKELVDEVRQVGIDTLLKKARWDLKSLLAALLFFAKAKIYLHELSGEKENEFLKSGFEFLSKLASYVIDKANSWKIFEIELMEEIPVIWEFEVFVVLAYLAKAGIGSVEETLRLINQGVSLFDKLIGDKEYLNKFIFSNQEQAEDDREIYRVITCVSLFSLRLQMAREALKDDLKREADDS